MGSERRKSRRAQERRAYRHRSGSARGANWPIFASAAALLVVLAVFAALGTIANVVSTKTNRPAAQALSAYAAGMTIDGIRCSPSEQVAYHVHAHLTILVQGKEAVIPRGIGLDDGAGCLYWLHTHNDSGVIHVETPYRITPLLGDFFDIWGAPLSRTRVWKFGLKTGQAMKAWVGRQLWLGDLRQIKLHRHTSITIEIGPPFRTPAEYDFGNL